MTEPQSSVAARGGYGGSPDRQSSERRAPADLGDILERVLDKGIVIAGDIKVNRAGSGAGMR